MDSIIVGSIRLARLNRTMACFSALKATKWKQRKPLAVEPPSEQCLLAAALKALCGDNRQLRKPKQMITATATALGDGMLAAVVSEQCSSAFGCEIAAKKGRPNRSSQKLQSRTVALNTLASIAEATIPDEDTSSTLDGLLQEPYLERLD